MFESKEKVLVMGIDIASGSPASRTAEPQYSVVIIRSDGKIIYETQFAPLRRVIRLVWEYRPRAIAVDNVFELAPSKKKLAKLLSLLPEDTEVIQVTFKECGFLSVRKLLSSLGYEVLTKPRSLVTAYLNAVLVLRGEGTPIKAVEHKTKIIISRGSSIGKGGSSAQRYARSMRASVLRMTRKIKEILDSAGLSYDLIFRKSSGGLDNAVFIVYAPRSALTGLVKPVRNSEVRVVVKPIYKTVLFVADSPEVEARKKYVIVGVDPGHETGLAVIDLSLKLLLLMSSRELDRSSIINRIYSVGIPVLIATDKVPPPDNVRKLSSVLGVPLFTPSHNPSTAEKETLIEWYRKRVSNLKIGTTHERDALAAALMAFRHYERNLKEVEERIREMGIDADIDEAKLMILRGKSVNEAIEAVLERVLSEEKEDREGLKQLAYKLARRVDEEQRSRELEKRVEELIRERELLRNEIKELRNRLEELEFQLRFTTKVEVTAEDLRDRTIAMLENRVKQLHQRVQILEKELDKQMRLNASIIGVLEGVLRGEYEILPLMKNLSKAEVKKILQYGASNKVYVKAMDRMEVEVLRELADSKVVLLTENVSEDICKILWIHGIALIENVKPILEIENVVVVPKHMISNEVISQAIKLMEDHRRRVMSETQSIIDEKKLIGIIEEYRKQVSEQQESVEESGK